MRVLGVEESEKKCAPPEDNFWNSPDAHATCLVALDDDVNCL